MCFHPNAETGLTQCDAYLLKQNTYTRNYCNVITKSILLLERSIELRSEAFG